jgi:hypothetical protein
MTLGVAALAGVTNATIATIVSPSREMVVRATLVTVADDVQAAWHWDCCNINGHAARAPVGMLR